MRKEIHIQDGFYKTLRWMGSGWFFLFLAGASFFYFQQMHKKEKLYQSLVQRKIQLEKERAFVLTEKQELEYRLKSQSRPEWIEMVLMRSLGLVPEGQIKVYFKTDK